MVIPGQIEGADFSLLAYLVQHKHADPSSSLSASQEKTESVTPQNLPISLGGGGCEEMPPALSFRVPSGLGSPLTDTPVMQPLEDPLADVITTGDLPLFSFLFCLLLGQTGSIKQQWLPGPGIALYSPCPGQSRGGPTLQHPQQCDGSLRQPQPPLGITLDTNALPREESCFLTAVTEGRGQG